MAPRGRRFTKGKDRKKGNFKGKTKGKTRKTYSLYGNNNKNNHKRKFETDKERNPELEENKRQKVEVKSEVALETSSSSDEEVEDPVQKLRETFKSTSNKKTLAIDSSEDSSENETDENIDEEKTQPPDLEVDNDDKHEEESDETVEETNERVKNDSTNEDNSPPEDEQNEIVEQNEIDDDLKSEANDPFVRHLFYDLNESLLNSVQSTPPKFNNFVENWNALGRLAVQIPHCDETDVAKPAISIDGEKKFAPAGTIPKVVEISKNSMDDLRVKVQIMNNLIKNEKMTFSGIQNEVFSILNNYQDLYFSQRTFDNADEIRFVYCLHAVNHILKTRTKIIHHNARLSRKDDVPDEFRDQGLVRPKILIIVPFRSSAHKIINTLIEILIPEDKGNVINKNRFIDDFTGNEIFMPRKNPKPEDYEQTFCGNCSDDFKIGITVTKKSLKLYADFYSSDIIVASPLGLRFTIGAEGEAERDYDFLASIELFIMDQTEIFLMQNWDHLLHIINHLHLQPKESHGTDFSRVRTWSLNGWSKYYRQTLIFSSVSLPEINAIFNKKCFNYRGKVKTANTIEVGSIGQVFVQLPHVFYKFSSGTPLDAIDERFNLFVNKILPQQKETLMKQTLVYVANYFDYVRLRNHFKREDVSFVQICEYSKEGKVARARDMFFHGDAHFLLYTERYHFYHRIRIKGIRHLVFYQIPSIPHFYSEMCNLMREANMNRKVGSMSNMTVTVLYSKYDTHQLAAVVGTEKAAKMVQSERNVHMMVTKDD